jgi:hypothetical protein
LPGATEPGFFDPLDKPHYGLYMARHAVRNASLGLHHLTVSHRVSIVATHVASGFLDENTTRTALRGAATSLAEANTCNCTLDQHTRAIDQAFVSALELRSRAVEPQISLQLAARS